MNLTAPWKEQYSSFRWESSQECKDGSMCRVNNHDMLLLKNVSKAGSKAKVPGAHSPLQSVQPSKPKLEPSGKRKIATKVSQLVKEALNPLVC